MGRAIVCETQIAKKPYVFPDSRQKIYSYEELCYFICSYPALFQFEFVTEEFILWIKQEIKAEKLQESLRELYQKQASSRAMVLVILESYSYCSVAQVRAVIEKLDLWGLQEWWKQKKHYADSLYQVGRYRLAKKWYDRLLMELGEAEENSVVLGAIWNNRASCLARDMQYQEAAESFQKSYELHPSEEALRGYWKVLYLTGQNEKIKEDIAYKDLPIRIYSEFMEAMEQKEEKLYDNRDYQKLEKAFKLKEEGKILDYQKKIQNLLTKWKRDYKDTIQ